ncbi:MAG: hypothetical protein AAGB19_05190 [Cyanobacteria bacterium P01_F01_bin.3]
MVRRRTLGLISSIAGLFVLYPLGEARAHSVLAEPSPEVSSPTVYLSQEQAAPGSFICCLSAARASNRR